MPDRQSHCVAASEVAEEVVPAVAAVVIDVGVVEVTLHPWVDWEAGECLDGCCAEDVVGPNVDRLQG